MGAWARWSLATLVLASACGGQTSSSSSRGDRSDASMSPDAKVATDDAGADTGHSDAAGSCLDLGADCGPNECCDGVCGPASVCVSCLSSGEFCLDGTDCCAGLECFGRQCTSPVACGPVGTACSRDLPCCGSVLCIDDVCRCGKFAELCSSRAPCCDGFSCSGGRCADEVACAEIDDECSVGTPCCGALVCVDDRCRVRTGCGDVTEPCVADGACCDELVCSSAACIERTLPPPCPLGPTDCTACVARECCAEVGECRSNTECDSALDCVESCVDATGVECMQSCFGDPMNPDERRLVTCALSSCLSECVELPVEPDP